MVCKKAVEEKATDRNIIQHKKDGICILDK